MKRAFIPLPALLTAWICLAGVSSSAAQQGIAVSMSDELDFGRIVVSGAAGAVAVTVDGERMASGGVHLGGGPAFGAARFLVTGAPDTVYSITLPAAELLWCGDSSMTVDTFVSSPSAAGNLGSAGTQVVVVGATLRMGAHQAAGAYAGTYTVTVAYQ